MTYVKTGYGAGGDVNTAMGLRGVDIPPVPDFWGDWESMRSRLKPKPQVQATALREPRMPRPVAPPTERVAVPSSNYPEGQRTARSFGTPSMSPQGVMGTMVNPIDIPPELIGTLPTGFFTDTASSNYTYSPTVGPQRYQTGKTQRV